MVSEARLGACFLQIQSFEGFPDPVNFFRSAQSDATGAEEIGSGFGETGNGGESEVMFGQIPLRLRDRCETEERGVKPGLRILVVSEPIRQKLHPSTGLLEALRVSLREVFEVFRRVFSERFTHDPPIVESLYPAYFIGEIHISNITISAPGSILS